MFKRSGLTLCFLALSIQSAVAQDSKPAPQPVQQEQDEPSLQETLDFIKGMIGNYRPPAPTYATYGSGDILVETNFNDCNIISTQKLPVTVSHGTGTTNTYKAMTIETTGSLKDLDPVSVVTGTGTTLLNNADEQWYLILKTTGERKLLLWRWTEVWQAGYAQRYEEIQRFSAKEREKLRSRSEAGYPWWEYPPQNKEDRVSAFYFRLDREQAKRLAKAFKHAITLCGGKVSPF